MSHDTTGSLETRKLEMPVRDPKADGFRGQTHFGRWSSGLIKEAEPPALVCFNEIWTSREALCPEPLLSEDL